MISGWADLQQFPAVISGETGGTLRFVCIRNDFRKFDQFYLLYFGVVDVPHNLVLPKQICDVHVDDFNEPRENYRFDGGFQFGDADPAGKELRDSLEHHLRAVVFPKLEVELRTFGEFGGGYLECKAEGVD
jgi:hypothetical protein